MQNSEFINAQVYQLWLRCSTLKVSKQQLETDGSLVIKVCYRWRITTNILPLYTRIKTLHKTQIIFSHNIALFWKRDNNAIILQCQRTLNLQRNAVHILKAHISAESFPFHGGKNIQDLPFSAPSHICHHTHVSSTLPHRNSLQKLKPAATAQGTIICCCCCRTGPTASAPPCMAAELQLCVKASPSVPQLEQGGSCGITPLTMGKALGCCHSRAGLLQMLFSPDLKLWGGWLGALKHAKPSCSSQCRKRPP